MRGFWREPYLWIHLAGIAGVPILVDVCLLGLAVGNPRLPVWLEVGIVGLLGTVPVLWMQWQRPFCIYSLLIFAVKAEHLSPSQRQLLRLFKTPVIRAVSGLAAVGLVSFLWQLYALAPIAADITPLASWGRGVGLLVAGTAFFLMNLFVQVPLSVLCVLLAREQTVVALEAYPPMAVSQEFTVIGWPVPQVLPATLWQAPVAPVQSVVSAPQSEGLDQEDSLDEPPLPLSGDVLSEPLPLTDAEVPPPASTGVSDAQGFSDTADDMADLEDAEAVPEAEAFLEEASTVPAPDFEAVAEGSVAGVVFGEPSTVPASINIDGESASPLIGDASELVDAAIAEDKDLLTASQAVASETADSSEMVTENGEVGADVMLSSDPSDEEIEAATYTVVIEDNDTVLTETTADEIEPESYLALAEEDDVVLAEALVATEADGDPTLIEPVVSEAASAEVFDDIEGSPSAFVDFPPTSESDDSELPADSASGEGDLEDSPEDFSA